MTYLVGRDGASLGKKIPLPASAPGQFGCASGPESFLACGAETAFTSASGRDPVGRDLERAVADSGGCIFATDDRGVHWFDSTGAFVKTVLAGANDVGPMAIGPESTLLVASPRGILHVIA